MTLALNLLVYSAVVLAVGFILTATPVATWWFKRMVKYMIQPAEKEMLSTVSEGFKAICQEDEDEEK